MLPVRLFSLWARVGCVAILLGGGLAAGAGGPAQRVWEVAKARPAVAGAPKASDVSMRSLEIHPQKKRAGVDPWDTFQAVRDFHATRLEWVFSLTAEQVRRAKALGLTVGGTVCSAEPDAQKSMKIGRVTGQDGLPKTHKWFPAGRWVGCVNAPEYRAAWLYQACRQVDAGVDVMQQDDPAMALSCTSLCYCKHCQAAFEKYKAAHGRGSAEDYKQFQRDSIVAFHREMHQALDAHAGRHVPFSCNNVGGLAGGLDWVTGDYDFANAEIDPRLVKPPSIYALATGAGARGLPLVFQYRDTSAANNRRALALFTANGATMMMPWDVFLPGNAPRYFAKAGEIADLSGFIRAMARYLDGYEDAAVAGPGLSEKRYGGAGPLAMEGGSGQACAFARALPGKAGAPVAIHLVEWAPEGRPLTLRLRTAAFTERGALQARLLVPPPYDAAAHRQAQASGDFAPLAVEAPVAVAAAGGETTVKIPALRPWGILVVEGK